MEPKYMPLITFPWLFEKELGRIATGIEAIDDLEDLGLQPLVLNGDETHSRKRNAAGVADTEDFVRQEDGVIVHRGEELDLFRPDVDSEDLSGESDFEEARYLKDGARYRMGESGEPVLATAFPESLSGPASGTGVEDVVPRTHLDGFIDPQEMSRETTLRCELDDIWPQSQEPKPSHDSPRKNSLSLSLIDDNIPEGDPARKYPHNVLDTDTPAQSPAVGNNVSSPLTGGLSPSSSASTLPSSEPEATEEPVVEEVVEVKVGESAFEKVARRFGP
jgi:RNA-dependent RNA polymerase